MRPRHAEAGMTLTEVTVVIILAAVLMTGIVTFYLNAQTMWLDGSSQAITQREATLALRTIAKRARSGAAAYCAGDPRQNMRLDIFNDQPADPESTFSFWLAPDSLIHNGYAYSSDAARQDLGPMMQSRVVVFAAHKDNDQVYVDTLDVLTPQGGHITMSTSVTLMNRRGL